MIKALISVDKDLGTSIAVRYAADLSNRIQIDLHDVHVVDSTKTGTPPGSGWVRNTWENAMIESERENLRQFLEMERVSHPLLKIPKMLFGARSEKLLEELHDGQFDLFMEGVVPTFNPLDFFTLIHSRLYRHMPCPALVVKNLVPLEKSAVIVTEATDGWQFSTGLAKIFENTSLGMDLFVLKFIKSDALNIIEKETAAGVLQNTQKVFRENGFNLDSCRRLEGTPQQISEFLREYGLVASALAHNIPKNAPLIELIGRITSPVLVCWD